MARRNRSVATETWSVVTPGRTAPQRWPAWNLHFVWIPSRPGIPRLRRHARIRCGHAPRLDLQARRHSSRGCCGRPVRGRVRRCRGCRGCAHCGDPSHGGDNGRCGANGVAARHNGHQRRDGDARGATRHHQRSAGHGSRRAGSGRSRRSSGRCGISGGSVWRCGTGGCRGCRRGRGLREASGRGAVASRIRSDFGRDHRG